MLKCMIWNFWGSYNNLCFQVTELKMKDEKEKWNQKSEYLYFLLFFLIFFLEANMYLIGYCTLVGLCDVVVPKPDECRDNLLKWLQETFEKRMISSIV